MKNYSIENKQIILKELENQREENRSQYINCLTRCNILLVIFSVLFVKFIDIIINHTAYIPTIFIFSIIACLFYYNFYLIIAGEKNNDFKLTEKDIDNIYTNKKIELFYSICPKILNSISEDRKNIENKYKYLKDMTILLILFSIGLIIMSI